MRKIYHLSSCSTCKRIIKDLQLENKSFDFQDIKLESITESQLDQMKEMSGSYESLFSRRSMKFRPMGLHEMKLTESDYKKHILEEYSFLKRPVIIIDQDIFIGNAKKNIEAAAQRID